MYVYNTCIKNISKKYCLKLDFNLGRIFFKRIIDAAFMKDLMVLAGFSRRDRRIKFFFWFNLTTFFDVCFELLMILT